MVDSINYSATGLVFDIQRFSVHDGPGIRTIAFLKGCPLSCKWCCNPESQKLKPVITYQKMRCIHCGKCMKACKQGAISPDNKGLVNRDLCIGCGECANVCPTGALVLKGTKMTVQQVVMELKKDATSYRRSGGGITISGGEPLVQSDFTLELLKAAKEQGWHTAIETTAYADGKVIEKVLPYVDLALLDIKSMNPEVHKKFTGVSNEIILQNAVRVSEITQTVIRVPTIPGVNADEEDILAISRFAKTLHNIKTIHLLPYHTYGENKYELLGRDYLMKDVMTLTPEKIQALKTVVEGQGLECIIGG